MKKLLLFLPFLFLAKIYAQTTNEGKPLSWSLAQKKNSKVRIINIPTIDIEKIKREDEIEAKKRVKLHRISVANHVNVGLNDDNWINLPNGDRIWKVLFYSKDALNLSVVFNKFYMPEGAKLYLYSDDRADLQGAYTSLNNNKKQKLGSWLVKGDKIWVEYYEPKEVTGQGILNISQIMHGYRLGKKYQKGYFDNKKLLNSSGDCNHDVNCPVGDDFDAKKDVLKKSVAFILMPDTDGNYICSGSLVNNTQQNKKPYFLTANHCYEKEDGSTLDEALYSMRFNWISPNPICGLTNNSTNTTVNQTMNGSTLKARNASSDFMLLELNNNIPESWDVVYAGWDKTDANPTFEVGIHHPDGDIMKVSRDDTGATKAQSGSIQLWLIGGGSQGVGNGWEIGVTEAGSSGSPLFNQNGHIIGQLYAGQAICNGTVDNDEYDIYGRFATSWNTGTNSSTRLKDWLDSGNLNLDTLDELKNVLSTNDKVLEQNISIFPNPTSGSLNIKTVNITSELKYQVFNLLGQNLKSGVIRNNEPINLSSLANAVYLVKITDVERNASLTKKIVISK